MNVELNEITESARQIFGDIGIAGSEEKTYPLMVELGLLQVAVPEELGGLGQGMAGACAIYREFGANLASGPYIASMLALDALCRSPSSDRELWLERITSGEVIAAPLAESSIAISDDRLSGLASAVTSADAATHILLWTSDCVALVPRDQKGVQITARPTWDVTRRLFDVRLQDVELRPALTLARGASANALAQQLTAHRDFALAADAAGGANELLNRTVEYLQGRKQFGRPLALFQALKHRRADLKMLSSAADALLTDSLNRLGDDAAENQLLGEIAKYVACSSYRQVAEEALQLHGGIGMTSEHTLHLFLKRALLDEHLGRRVDRAELDIAASVLGTG